MSLADRILVPHEIIPIAPWNNNMIMGVWGNPNPTPVIHYLVEI